jgi:predicted CoA-binding protein
MWHICKIMAGTTLILGASPKSDRYSYLATEKLVRFGHAVAPVGLRSGKIGDVDILTGKPALSNIETVTIYLSAKNQEEWYPYILNLKPKRIIFNPGAENPELEALAHLQGIATENACTLVMLSTGSYDI